ncbi:TetR/AcrR family transcriptional regulator [Agromyces sp. SYSU K20354]|uniref:TetR/AcrR family transcriptional regulator n=1 Tax=Agromyces cavernae TaxID=2898659 RepID=UPI001E365A04|nr:TetR family transcriptional regulator [Agromyces cavernae]MCD2443327.1 TetR/AcrR family transcriptional regulator [Agromyces cavernae]
MVESATKSPGVREQRRERTRRELTRQARLLTMEHGLNGFTVEELCERVGVSRRTFFNYFPSKDDAVIGHRDDTLDEHALTDFVNARPSGCLGISPTLMDDLVALAIASIPFDHASLEDEPNPEMLVEREPHLLPRFVREGAELERMLTGVVATREQIAIDDPRAAMAVQLIGTLVRRSAAVYFSPGNTTEFSALLVESLDAARALFTPIAQGTE